MSVVLLNWYKIITLFVEYVHVFVLLNWYKIITLFVEYVHFCCVVKLVKDNYIIRGVRPCLLRC